MSIFRSYVMPFVILIVFLVAMLAVSARIWLPSDMLAPAPIDGDELALLTKALFLNGFGS